MFCRLRRNGVDKAWIGLSKLEANCGHSDYECRMSGWSWLDGTEYQYPTWHKWPVRHELQPEDGYAFFNPSGWHGQRMHINMDAVADPYDINHYICEKGILNTLSLCNISFILHCCLFCLLPSHKTHTHTHTHTHTKRIAKRIVTAHRNFKMQQKKIMP